MEISENESSDEDNCQASDESEVESEEDDDNEKSEEVTASVQDIFTAARKYFPDRFEKLNEQTIRGSFKAITKTGSRLALRVGTEFDDTWLGDPIESIGNKMGAGT